KYDLISGLQNSLVNDYLINGQDKLEVDFSVDDEILKAG
ncbi:MAG: 3-beta hydroxysteroid dehydrogenase, partial [Dolichospermum sp.]|nr:3-beta hydroxysteroid dehydrogenase [Dolichospermum sp.]